MPDSWLREFLKTPAKPEKIAESLSLCGPSVERIEKVGTDWVYHIEITTNRVDSAGVWGLAREATAILPRFGIQTKLDNPQPNSSQKLVKSVSYLKAKLDPKLCPRFTAILIKNVKIRPSPDYIKKRLELVGLRPINNVVDISNYLMHEFGQPLHTFDYDKIQGSQMWLRASKKGERLTTLDGKTHTLPGDDIVISDGEDRLIDLAGIMGGENSAVDDKTQNVLLFVQTYNPINIRKTSMALAQRSEAASLFEKGLDPELVEPTIRRGIDLFVKFCDGAPEQEILDIYPAPYKPQEVKTSLSFINERLGINLEKNEVEKILESLGFSPKWKDQNLEVSVPSWRAQDIEIPEDIVEEVARLYGYHNLPSTLMAGLIPDPLPDSPFEFEMNVKCFLKGVGGVEVYTPSLVLNGALKLKNPLGTESEYLRNVFSPSLFAAAEANKGEKEPFHLFEMANVYLLRKNDLPEERMTLGGIFVNFDFRHAKGIVESLLLELSSDVNFVSEEITWPDGGLVIKNGKDRIGIMGVWQDMQAIYYEFDTEKLRKVSGRASSFIPIPKYPPQIEDISLVLPARVKVGELIEKMRSVDSQIISVELIDIFDNTKTFRITYQNPQKTLTDQEVEKIRSKILSAVRQKFGARVK